MKRLILIILLPAFIIFTTACALTSFQKMVPPAQVVAQAQVLATNDPNASTTPTPFQPLGPTATPTITSTPNITETVAAIEFITQTEFQEITNQLPEGQVNIMLLGNDYRPSSGYRTDVMVLISINPKKQIVNAISFPRDLYVEIPGRGYDRLNTAMPYGGFYLFQQTMDLNFHVKPDYYLMTNFTGFANIINSMGGIEVNCSRNLYDTCDLPQAVNGYCSAGPGIVQMNGETALWYVRSRYTSNDFDRNRRQQEVLMAIFKRFASFDVITKAPELYNAYRNTVETNLDLETILKMIPIVPSLNEPGHLNQYYITQAHTTNYLTESGAWVLIPNQAAIQQLIQQVIYNP